jgi:hypothetical protein
VNDAPCGAKRHREVEHLAPRALGDRHVHTIRMTRARLRTAFDDSGRSPRAKGTLMTSTTTRLLTDDLVKVLDLVRGPTASS